eukprot:CAMPEP_0194380204 /NCGR_PEP_ID=MMETSP0174-20130528/43440_1 /TAXON_ID=216777 /ORGANISM="Proboscia alata, Strain PI-D3" /LENGTH=273 /DNA_ID=CAMNT_0039163441 /DNA_START=36 /DNA_END=857 /DNA_ORIENTATION=+
MQNDKQINWSAFEGEAGRLLARLYGGNEQKKSQINYPQLKRRRNAQIDHKKGWVAVNGKAGSSDPRSASARSKTVAVPKVGGGDRRSNNGRNSNAAVDFIPKRKSASSCKADIEKYEIRAAAYRPPHVHTFSSEKEKQRLNEIFTFKGGLALPEELTNPVGPCPSELAWRDNENKRVHEAKVKRDGQHSYHDQSLGVGVDSKKKQILNSSDLLFSQILLEIKERREFQRAMEETGGGRNTRNSVSQEIASRIKKLQQINRRKAEEVIRDLYSK